MELTFNEQEHAYYLNDKQLISTTQLLRVMNIAPSLDAIPQEILEKAAEYGTFIHKELENYIKLGDLGLSGAVDYFARECANNLYEPIFSEYMVHDDNIAGTIDCVLKDNNGKHILIDFKTTSKVNTYLTAWQLSIYAYLYEKQNGIKVDRIELWHFDKNNGNALKVYKLEFVPREQVLNLIDCYLNSKPYEQLESVSVDEIDKVIDLQEKINFYETIIDELKSKLAEHQEKVVKSMKAENSSHYENDKITITIVAPTTRKTFDSKKFQAEHLDTYNEYLKETTTKESIRIKLKE